MFHSLYYPFKLHLIGGKWKYKKHKKPHFILIIECSNVISVLAPLTTYEFTKNKLKRYKIIPEKIPCGLTLGHKFIILNEKYWSGKIYQETCIDLKQCVKISTSIVKNTNHFYNKINKDKNNFFPEFKKFYKKNRNNIWKQMPQISCTDFKKYML